MMRLIRKLFFFSIKTFLGIALFISIERFCHTQTDGFMLSKVQSDFAFDPRWEHPPLPEEKISEIKHLLDQKFTYLKSGGQCYAFISEDQTVILKLFKIKHIREIHWMSDLSLPEPIDFRNLKFLRYRKKRFQNLFSSCKIAYEDLQEETGLLYSHLNKTSFLKQQVTLRDKLGIFHVIDLDQTEFLLQKKAELVYPKLNSLMQQNDVSSAKECIDSLFALFLSRYQKGIDDKDAVIRKNFGFIGNKAIEIDLGSFSKKEELKDPAIYREKFQKETNNFANWIQENHPSLFPYVSQKRQEVAQASSE